MHNATRDFKESRTLLFSLVESATWWLQPQLRSEMEKKKNNRWPAARTENYLQTLREAGASEAYIEKERKAILQEQEGSGFLTNMGDNLQILEGGPRG